MNGNQQRSESYRSVRQFKRENVAEKCTTSINEKLLPERIFFGNKTYLYVAILRYFKLGGYRGTDIKTIADLAQYIYNNGKLMKHIKGQFIPLELSSIITELYRIEAVIKQEDTKSVDPYGYIVKINS